MPKPNVSAQGTIRFWHTAGSLMSIFSVNSNLSGSVPSAATLTASDNRRLKTRPWKSGIVSSHFTGSSPRNLSTGKYSDSYSRRHSPFQRILAKGTVGGALIKSSISGSEFSASSTGLSQPSRALYSASRTFLIPNLNCTKVASPSPSNKGVNEKYKRTVLSRARLVPKLQINTV
eukprot:gnl/MRDRNA2_/MRDRNA2_83965_c0_seq5.p1 gnl/MRDRNA2_/MRDRNA2_83965_c0~~gnl/MRDRNA2_/MRDRNA2_83965_c0_seq5.p1  ORF type:complete len:175 (-),score=10.46 gnl/MRDRNA2_/MRDRNA2_83965_c0_seq5:72-596(-)